MKRIVLTISLLILSLSIFANNNHEKGLEAHEHGSIELDVAVEGKVMEVEIDGPTESFLGFEHKPVTENEKKIFKDAEVIWTQGLLTKLFLLDKKLGCTSSEVSFKQVIEHHAKNDKKESGIHSDIEAKAKITCEQDLKDQSLVVNVKKHFYKIKKLTINLVATETKKIQASQSQVIKL